MRKINLNNFYVATSDTARKIKHRIVLNLLPKLMGALADKYNMSRGFIVPLVCFAFVAFYGFSWPRLSKSN
jgi:hypothetical protein